MRRTTIRAISDEAVRLARAVQMRDLPPVTGVSIDTAPGSRRSLDLIVTWHHKGGTHTVVPVNVKTRTRSQPTNDLALSLRELLRFVTQPDYDLTSSPRSGPSADEILVELLAGVRKLVPGRDYYLLIIDTENGHMTDWRWQGLLSEVTTDGRLAISRHASRDNVRYCNAAGVIPDNFDIATALTYALLPAGSPSRLRAEILTATPRRKRRALAVTLQQLTDDELLRTVTQALSA